MKVIAIIFCTFFLFLNIRAMQMHQKRSKKKNHVPTKNFTLDQLYELKLRWFDQWNKEYQFRDAGKKSLELLILGFTGMFTGLFAKENFLIICGQYSLCLSAAYLIRAALQYKKLRQIDDELSQIEIDYFYR